MKAPLIQRLQNWFRPASRPASARLYPALRDGDTDLLASLLAAGADPELRSPDGQTPLMYAAALDRPDLLRLLLEAGADPLARNSAGLTALDVAVTHAAGEAVALLLERGGSLRRDAAIRAVAHGRRELFPLLFPSGNAERDAFREAARRGDAEAIAGFLALGLQAEDRDEDGVTPLLLVCHSGRVAAARVLLDAGAGVDTADRRGATPLLQAIHWNQTMLAGFLLEAGAHPARADAHGTTPLAAASARGQRDIVHMLKLRLGAASAGEQRMDPDGDEARRWQLWEEAMTGRIRHRHEERDRLQQAGAFRQEKVKRIVPAGRGEREALALLGLDASADPTAIKRAYHQRMRECHPDRLMDRPEAVRRAAEARAKEINAAYATLRLAR